MCHAQLHFNVNMYAKFDLKCISPSIFGIICHYHGNTLSCHCRNSAFCTSTPYEANMWAKFHFKCVKNWGSSSWSARVFPPFSCHNMLLPWQHTFCHCQKNVSCTSTPQGKHLCQISWEFVKTEEVACSSRRKIFPPFCHMLLPWQHFLPLWKMHLAHLHPRGKHLCQISWELVKNWGSSSRCKIFPPFLP